MDDSVIVETGLELTPLPLKLSLEDVPTLLLLLPEEERTQFLQNLETSLSKLFRIYICPFSVQLEPPETSQSESILLECVVQDIEDSRL